MVEVELEPVKVTTWEALAADHLKRAEVQKRRGSMVQSLDLTAMRSCFDGGSQVAGTDSQPEKTGRKYLMQH